MHIKNQFFGQKRSKNHQIRSFFRVRRFFFKKQAKKAIFKCFSENFDQKLRFMARAVHSKLVMLATKASL